MRKRGFTIVELMVSMSIFVVLTTLAVGAFISINHFRDLGNNMNESQQKLRLATELITRLSRQAGEVSVSTDNQSVLLTFNPTGIDLTDVNNSPAASNITFAKFEITGSTINYYPETPCPTANFNATTHHCDTPPTFSTPVSLLAGSNGSTVTLKSTSGFFENTNQVPLTLRILLDGQVNAAGFSSDTFVIDTETVLENMGGIN